MNCLGSRSKTPFVSYCVKDEPELCGRNAIEGIFNVVVLHGIRASACTLEVIFFSFCFRPMGPTLRTIDEYREIAGTLLGQIFDRFDFNAVVPRYQQFADRARYVR